MDPRERQQDINGNNSGLGDPGTPRRAIIGSSKDALVHWSDSSESYVDSNAVKSEMFTMQPVIYRAGFILRDAGKMLDDKGKRQWDTLFTRWYAGVSQAYEVYQEEEEIDPDTMLQKTAYIL